MNSRFKSIAVSEEIYNLIKKRAKENYRGISNQLEYELLRNKDDRSTS